MEAYPKVITDTDARDRLSVSAKRLKDGFFELAAGESSRNFVVFDAGDEGRLWTFDLRIRPQPQPYKRPVISGDWLNFVRDKNVQAGDTVVFFKQCYYDQATGTERMRYRIGVGRELLKLFGVWHLAVVGVR